MLEKDTIVMTLSNILLPSALVFEEGVDAFYIVSKAFENIEENYPQKQRTSYAYYREELIQGELGVGGNISSSKG